MKERIDASIGQQCKIFLNNGFKYEGVICRSDDEFVEINEPNRGIKVLRIVNISELNVLCHQSKVTENYVQKPKKTCHKKVMTTFGKDN